MKELFAYFTAFKKRDPEFHEKFENFAFDEVFENSLLSKKESILVILASLIGCQSPKAFKKILKASLNMDITPVEVKQLLYQSVVYVGFGKAHNFFGVVSKVFDMKDIEYPLESQYVAKDEVNKNHFESFCFDDIYDGGLSECEKQLIAFSLLVSHGGCENQLESNIESNLDVGNDGEKLISVLRAILPYIGVPRASNALEIIKNRY